MEAAVRSRYCVGGVELTALPKRDRLVAMRKGLGKLVRRFSLASVMATLSLCVSASPASKGEER